MNDRPSLNRKPIPVGGYLWPHPLPSYLWPERYDGLRTAEQLAVAMAVTECVGAWHRNDPATVAEVLRDADRRRAPEGDNVDIAALSAFFISQPIRHDPNPPAIANWLREHARQDHLIRQQLPPYLMGSDWDDGGTADQQMLAELDMITFAELVAANDEAGVRSFVSRRDGIDQTPVFGSASSGTRILARLWTPEICQNMREVFGGKSDD